MKSKVQLTLLTFLTLVALHPLLADDALKLIDDSSSEKPSSTKADPSVFIGGTQSNPSTPAKKRSHTSSSGGHSSSKVMIWGPRDKLPKDIAGQEVAGDFVLNGEYAGGGEMLIPAEDIANPFARTFIVANVSSGFARGTYLDLPDRTPIHIPRSNPLIFVGRGDLIGSYVVRQK